MAKSKFVPQFLRTFVTDITEHAAEHEISDTLVKVCEGFCACGDQVAEHGPKVVAEIAMNASPAVALAAANALPGMAAMAASVPPAAAAAAMGAAPAVAAMAGLPVIGPLAIALGLFGVTTYMKCAKEAREAKEREEAFAQIRQISAAVAELNTGQAGVAEKLIALVEGNTPVWARICEDDQESLAHHLRCEFEEEFSQLNVLLRVQGIRVSDTNDRVRTIENSIDLVVKGNASIVTAITAVHDDLAAMMGQQTRRIVERMDEQFEALRAEIAKQAQLKHLDGEPLDNLVGALKRLVDLSDSRGQAMMNLTREGNYAQAGEVALKLAEDETAAAARLRDAMESADQRAAARWSDAGDILFVSDQQKAADAYKRSLQYDPNNLPVRSRLGHALVWLGRLGEALQAYTIIWYTVPDGIANLARSVDQDAARRNYEKFLREHPEWTPEAFHYVTRGIVIAGIFIVEIIRREPALIRTWILRMKEVGADGKARTPTESEAPGLMKFFTERVYAMGSLLGENSAQIEHRLILEDLSEMAFHKGETELSAEYLRRAREMSQQLKDLVAEATYLSNLGIIGAREGQYNTAREHLQQAIAICEGDPGQDQLVVTLGQVSPEEGERRLAEAEQRRAAGAPAKLAEDDLVVCNSLREEFARDPETAFRRAMSLKVVEGNAHATLAQIALFLGDVEQAKREFTASLKIHESILHTEGIAKTCNTLGELALKEDKIEEACAHWGRAKELLTRAGNTDAAAYFAHCILQAKQKAVLLRKP
ncbi:MAG TPA: tetratricopeptide repeat protein [Candidatus Methylacidiphilales bacterium]|jgi:tetratricopeptide (TPR) repeat protein|nr:tetratricopeptide repeat protein [Candidatus Methylacidiphilales bacterium]